MALRRGSLSLSLLFPFDSSASALSVGQTWQRAVDEPATTDPHPRLSASSTQGTGIGPGARAVLLRGG
jgi:hypothetical protein